MDSEMLRLNCSFPGSALSKALCFDDDDFLAQSCSARVEGSSVELNDDELTNLGWLQNTDLLTSMNFSRAKSLAIQGIVTDDKEELVNEFHDFETSPPTTTACYDPFVHYDSKPPYSFSMLIFMAIDQAKGKKLSVKDIYEWIYENFPYYQSAQAGWKNSVRHNLSLNKCFRKVEKDTEGNHGKGSLWTVDPDYRPALLDATFKATNSLQSFSQTHSVKSLNNSYSNAAANTPCDSDYPLEMEVVSALLSMKHASSLSHPTIDHRNFPQPLRTSSPVLRLPSSSTSLDHSYSRCIRGVNVSAEHNEGDSGNYDGYDTDDTEPFGADNSRDEESDWTSRGVDALMHLAHTATATGQCEMEGVDYTVSSLVIDSQQMVGDDRVNSPYDHHFKDRGKMCSGDSPEVLDDSGVCALEQRMGGEGVASVWPTVPTSERKEEEVVDQWQAICYRHAPTITPNFLSTGMAF